VIVFTPVEAPAITGAVPSVSSEPGGADAPARRGSGLPGVSRSVCQV